jgi:hypothetical protein
LSRIALVLAAASLSVASVASATTIREVLEAPATPGNAWSGTFFITPSEPVWAFGVGNDAIQDTSISGIAFIDGLEANDHWISSLIHRSSWDAGFDFDSIRPIGASPPSSFSMATSSSNWEWGSADYVAFYWLSEAGASENLAILEAGTEYGAFRFFADGPASPFAAFTSNDGATFSTGETTVEIIPEPSAAVLVSLGAVALASARSRARSPRTPRGR